MTVDIRRATQEDASSIARLVELSFGETVSASAVAKTLSEERGVTHIAEERGTIIGFIDGFPTISQSKGVRWELDLLAIHPEYRGRGIGRALIDASTWAGRQQGARVSRALVAVTNTPMHRAMTSCHYLVNLPIAGLVICQSLPDLPVDGSPHEAHLIPVKTIRYTGIWIEGKISLEALQAAESLRVKTASDRCGAVIPMDETTTLQLLHQAGFEHVGLYQWWLLTL